MITPSSSIGSRRSTSKARSAKSAAPSRNGRATVKSAKKSAPAISAVEFVAGDQAGQP